MPSLDVDNCIAPPSVPHGAALNVIVTVPLTLNSGVVAMPVFLPVPKRAHLSPPYACVTSQPVLSGAKPDEAMVPFHWSSLPPVPLHWSNVSLNTSPCGCGVIEPLLLFTKLNSIVPSLFCVMPVISMFISLLPSVFALYSFAAGVVVLVKLLFEPYGNRSP